MDEFEIELKQGFIEEATQLLQDAEQAFLGLESRGDDPDLLDQIFRVSVWVRMEFSAFDPSYLGQISGHVKFIIHVESLVMGLDWAAVFNEFATFRHHCEIVVDLLRHLDWFVIKILKVSLSDHCLLRVTFDQMIRGISDLLVVKGK